MLTRLIDHADVVSESRDAYNAAVEYEYRDAEYEYEEQPEPWIEPESVVAHMANCCSRKSMIRSKILCGPPRLCGLCVKNENAETAESQRTAEFREQHMTFPKRQ